MSLAFLDVITCGFGAVILMLVLTKVFEPVVLQETTEHLQTYLADLQQDLAALRVESTVTDRQLAQTGDELEDETRQLARLQQELLALQSRLDNTRSSNTVSGTIRAQLEQAHQQLTEEMKRLLAQAEPSPLADSVGGIPVDSEYIIFIIDTSGSMFNYAWPLMLQKVEETLDIYPQLKGIQVMNDMGNYMFPQYAGRFIPDTPARRRQIVTRLETWNAFSNSSPVEGITRAVGTFYKPGRKISLYVFGDEFTGRSTQAVIDAVDRINRPDEAGERLVRIHAVGFPVMFAQPPRFQDTGIKFAVLMRELCARNGGTFVGLDQFRF